MGEKKWRGCPFQREICLARTLRPPFRAFGAASLEESPSNAGHHDAPPVATEGGGGFLDVVCARGPGTQRDWSKLGHWCKYRGRLRLLLWLLVCYAKCAAINRCCRTAAAIHGPASLGG